IEHLQSITEFETEVSEEVVAVSEGLAPLRDRLFNVTPAADLSDENDSASQVNNLPSITLLECGDREIEIRSIGKEIKRLILEENYRLSEIALVVRQRA